MLPIFILLGCFVVLLLGKLVVFSVKKNGVPSSWCCF